MRTKVIPIGNSRGIRIPKALIEELGLTGEVDICVTGQSLLLTPIRPAREGWAESIAAATEEDLALATTLNAEFAWADYVETEDEQEQWQWPTEL